jgi:hypothetical protein
MGSRGFGYEDYLYDLGFGLRPGFRRIIALGNNPSVDTASVPEDIWTGGGLYPWMTAATSLEAVSGSANDTAAGTGARTIIVNGLDINYAEISETVTMNGATAVPLVAQFFRINSVLTTTVGSLQVNDGDITIRDAGAGTTRAIMPLGKGILRQSQFTVPAGHFLQVTDHLFTINRSGGTTHYATVSTWQRNGAGIIRMPLEVSFSERQPYLQNGVPGIPYPEKTDVQMRCTNVTANSTDLTVGWLGLLRKNQQP